MKYFILKNLILTSISKVVITYLNFHDDQLSIIDNELEFSQLSKAGDHLFVRLKNDGLYEINNDSLEYVPNGKYFKERHFFSAEQLDGINFIKLLFIQDLYYLMG